MTNEQAIAELQKERDLIQGEHDLDGSQFAPALLEALAMAIEVLKCSEIPNCSDCIDRAEAQTAIQFAARRYTVAHEAHGEGHVVWSDNLISVTDAMNALREVPSAQPERDIPVKPIETTDKAWGIPKRQAVCPKCDYYLGHVAFLGDYKGKRITYCEVCGQAIDWSES